MTEMNGPDPIDVEVGQRLRAFRLSKKLSQTAMGEAGGISFQQVQKYERGVNRLSASMMCRLAKVLDIDPADLLPPSERGPDAEPIDLASLQSRDTFEAAQLLRSFTPRARRAAISMLRLIALSERERGEMQE